jgi:signal transduction histidine kinase/ActR/RegA family two-component response regulator
MIFNKKKLGYQLILNPLNLSFTKEQKNLEKDFLEDYYQNNLYLFRICHLFAILFYSLFAIIDLLVFPEQKYFLWFIRFGIVAPVFIVSFIFTFSENYKKSWSFLNNFYVVMTGTGFTVMVIYLPPPMSYFYTAGITICLLFGYAFIRSRFFSASIAGLILTSSFIIASFLINTPENILLINSFVIFIINILGMIICYSSELYARKDYFLRSLLKNEKLSIQNINENLEEVILERTQKLSKSNQLLLKEIEERKTLESQLVQAQKMEAIGTLAGGIAHDFNNILGVIMGYTELNLNDNTNPKKRIKNLQHVMKASIRAKEMVQQILAFSRKDEKTMISVNVENIIKETASFLRSTIPTTIDIKFNFEKDSGQIFGNATQINQVLMNLCTNAAYAMKENGGVLEICLKKVKLDKGNSILSGLQSGDYLQLTVSDTGTGMSKEIVERIFEPYFTTKAVNEGTGMGLSVIFGIVKNHRGDIKVYSEPGKGTIFNIFFPKLDAVNKENIQIEVKQDIRGNNERILFLDDEKTLAELGTHILTNLGYHVKSITSSIEALELFTADPDKYDLVITDMTMPDMTGVKLASEIHKIRPDISVILCTGFSDGVNKENYKDKGISALIMKPVVKRELADAIRGVLDKKIE